MADRTLQLSESVQGTADGSGGLRLSVGPNHPGTRWQVRSVALSGSVVDPSPTAKLYLGATPNPGAYLGGTYDGAADSTDLAVTLYPGQVLTVVWDGAAAGAVLTMAVLGDLVAEV